MRWVIFGALVIVAVSALLFHLQSPSSPTEPKIVGDSVTSDPECYDLLVRVAQRESTIFESIEGGQKPVGMKCAIGDIVKAMKSEGAIVESNVGNTIRFMIKSKERWLFSKKSKFGSYQNDLVRISRYDDGTIRSIIFNRPYIT